MLPSRGGIKKNGATSEWYQYSICGLVGANGLEPSPSITILPPGVGGIGHRITGEPAGEGTIVGPCTAPLSDATFCIWPIVEFGSAWGTNRCYNASQGWPIGRLRIEAIKRILLDDGPLHARACMRQAVDPNTDRGGVQLQDNLKTKLLLSQVGTPESGELQH